MSLGSHTGRGGQSPVGSPARGSRHSLACSRRHGMQYLSRLLMALTVALGLSFALGGPTLYAREGWPRLPTSDEILQAQNRFVAEWTFTHGPCASRCTPDLSGMDLQLCLARQCMDEFRLGPEIRQSKVTETEVVKAHDPQVVEPAASGYVFLAYTRSQTLEDSQGQTAAVQEYGIEMLDYDRDSGWFFNSDEIHYDVTQQDPASRSQRDAELDSYFKPGRLVRGFPDEELGRYRLSITSHAPAYPLRYTIRLDQKAASGSEYQPIAGAKLRLHAFDLPGNDGRLSLQFLAPTCQNCDWKEVDGHKLAVLKQAGQPIVVITNENGEAEVELFLDFAKLGEQVPRRDRPLAIPVLAEYWIVGSNGTEQKATDQRAEVKLDSVAIVEGITYVPPQMFHPITERPLPLGGEAPLSIYVDDPGTMDGPLARKGADRVVVFWNGMSTLQLDNTTPGVRLNANDLLHIGDKVTVNACDMVSNLVRDGLPAGQPGRIWVQVHFFDGLRGRFGVSGSVCKASMIIGGTPGESGFASSGTKFLYWMADKGMDAAIEWAFWPYKVVSKGQSAWKLLKWAFGGDSVFVVLQSAFAVEFDQQGQMHITTREGQPIIVTEGTGEDGVPVPVGKTALVPDTLVPSLSDTDTQTAKRTDDLLASLDSEPLDSSDPAGGETPQPDRGVISLQDLLLPGGVSCLGIVIIVVVGAFAVANARRRPASGAPGRSSMAVLGCVLATAIAVFVILVVGVFLWLWAR